MKQQLLIFICVSFTGILFAQSPHAAQLYGMSQYGGPDHRGSIFHFTPSTKTVTIDYDFKITVTGKSPKCDIVTGNNGKYYGTTTAGGAYDAGVVFSWDSATSEYKEMYDFTGIDGKDARGGMVLFNTKFYGLTNKCGINDMGVIYEWDIATNVYTKKYDMDSINGKNPDGSLTLIGTDFYGFTHDGGINNLGVLFKWNPATNVYTKLYDFTNSSGSHPVGKLVPYNGKLYAMTNTGGTLNQGVIYEWNYLTNVYTKKHDFDSINGQHPMGFLTLYNNKFYGLTYEGGIYETTSPYDHFGVIFEWNPVTNVFVKKKNMGNAINTIAHGSLSSLTLKGNLFYGTTSDGIFGCSIFSWNPATNVYSDNYLNSYSFTACDPTRFAPGLLPYGALLLSGNKLLGAFADRAGQGFGTISEYYPDSNQITRAVHMRASDAAYPRGSFTRLGNKLFGQSYNGGNNHQGNIFEWDLSTQQFTQRFEFDGYNTGINPMGTLTFFNGKFYGITTYGKSFNSGVWASYSNRFYSDFFSWDPATNLYQTHYTIPTGVSLPTSFSVLNNQLICIQPKTVLISPPNTYSYLTILKFNPTTNTVDDNTPILGGGVFYNYQDNESGNGLTYYNGKYYGMTCSNWDPAVGFVLKGSIYEWDTSLANGIHKLSFTDSTTSTYPTGDLVLVDSIFYGLTTGASSGGIYASGGLFKWNPQTNQAQLLNHSGGSGTPIYSEGKLYYFVGAQQVSVVEYDIALDTTYYYSLPTYGAPFYTWSAELCAKNSYPKLIEIIPNKAPVLSSIPTNQITCNNRTDSVSFTISDADMDTMNFQITSSNISLLPISNIMISNIDSNYTLQYTPVSNQTGNTTISIVADDGYGDSVSFSFIVVVNPISSSLITQSACNSFTFNNQTYTNTGTYTQQYTNVQGCDSIITLNLTINTTNTAITQNGSLLSATELGATYQWISCNPFTSIPGATSQTYTAVANGDYAVVVTKNGCSDTSLCATVIGVGINQITLSDSMNIQPNPTNSILSVQLPVMNELRQQEIKIYNEVGELVSQSTININGSVLTIDVSQFASGIYLLSLETTKGVYRSKFIKE